MCYFELTGSNRRWLCSGALNRPTVRRCLRLEQNACARPGTAAISASAYWHLAKAPFMFVTNGSKGGDKGSIPASFRQRFLAAYCRIVMAIIPATKTPKRAKWTRMNDRAIRLSIKCMPIGLKLMFPVEKKQPDASNHFSLCCCH